MKHHGQITSESTSTSRPLTTEPPARATCLLKRTGRPENPGCRHDNRRQ
jgi:hypothetical protein